MTRLAGLGLGLGRIAGSSDNLSNSSAFAPSELAKLAAFSRAGIIESAIIKNFQDHIAYLSSLGRKDCGFPY